MDLYSLNNIVNLWSNYYNTNNTNTPTLRLRPLRQLLPKDVISLKKNDKLNVVFKFGLALFKQMEKRIPPEYHSDYIITCGKEQLIEFSATVASGNSISKLIFWLQTENNINFFPKVMVLISVFFCSLYRPWILDSCMF